MSENKSLNKTILILVSRSLFSGGNIMISSKTTEPVSVKKKTVNVKDVHIEDGTIMDIDGSIIDRLVDEVGDSEFSFKITLPVVDEEGNE